MAKSNVEKDLKSSFKKGDFEILSITKAEKESYQEAARRTLLKDKSITIRINSKDLEAIKSIAVKSGKRYQSYIGELLHDHVARRKKVA
jgi:predicted DNA binding CopG/RHH family protein